MRRRRRSPPAPAAASFRIRFSSTSQREQRAGRAALSCSGHGAVNGTQCVCAALYRGPRCQVAIGYGKEPNRAKAFTGNYVLNQEHLESLTELKTETPLKTLSILPNITHKVRVQLQHIIPQTDVLRGQFFQTCALVASSGVLLRSHLGKDIDQHDMVIRFNAAPTKGFEHFVGTKTTFRISNGEHLGFKESDEIVLHQLRSKSFLVKLLWFNIKFHDQMPYIIDPDFAAYVAQATDHIPSSGYFAILLASQMCHQVSLFGFYASNRHGARHHYFNSEVPSNRDRDESEYERVMLLVKHGLVRFGDPCVQECHDSKERCEACWGGASLEELASQERWSPAMKAANARRDKQWSEFVKWDWKMDLEWCWDDETGLSPIPISRQLAMQEKAADKRHQAHLQKTIAKREAQLASAKAFAEANNNPNHVADT